MRSLNAIMLSGKEVLPLVEGGKGISISNGITAGAWAAAGGVGTLSAVNADSYDMFGNVLPIIYHGKTRLDRHRELIEYAIKGGIAQVKVAYETAKGNGRIHINVLWEMAAVEEILKGVLQETKNLVNGITCGAGMPYRLAEIAASFEVFYYPIVSSARAFSALWRRAYHKFSDWLGGVVYEDPWRAGGHNGLSNKEDPNHPQDPYERVVDLRREMNHYGLNNVPLVMAGGVWFLRDWENWFDNPEIGPITFQFGTRPLLTQESPISPAWKAKLLTLKPGDVVLNKFSPTGFYSSAVRNAFLDELFERSARQIAYSKDPEAERNTALAIGQTKRQVYLTAADFKLAQTFIAAGYSEAMRTPNNTIIFVTPSKAQQIRNDQTNCMGCLSACLFSSWTQDAEFEMTSPDPRSFCIQKTLQSISHDGNIDEELMFAGHNAYKFAQDPFYADGFIPTVRQLVDRIATGD